MRKLQLILMCVIIIFSAHQGIAQKVYQWHGENRDGIYNETYLMKKWPDNGPQILWSTEEIGAGFAAPVIANDKVLINGETDGTSYLFAFDLKGKLLWKAPNGKEFKGTGYATNFPGARSTPTVVGDLVYATSGNGRLACFELATGKERWAAEMTVGLSGIENEFGYSESPLIDGDNLYCMPGGPVNNVVALNRLTGKTIWTSKAMGDTTSFCSPFLINLSQRKIFVSLSHHYIFGVDAQNGELLWSQKLENFKYDGEHCNTPVYTDGFIYYTAGDGNGNGTVKLELSPDGKSIKEVWRNKAVGNGFGGLVKVDKNLFLTTNQKKLVCLDANSGVAIDSLKPNPGSLIYADKLFYCYNQTGEMKLIKFENNKFTEISKFKINKGTKEHFSHPVIAGGTLYIRHGKALMAYNIKEQ
jgi:outer membrane protein assembly factor BamB